MLNLTVDHIDQNKGLPLRFLGSDQCPRTASGTVEGNEIQAVFPAFEIGVMVAGEKDVEVVADEQFAQAVVVRGRDNFAFAAAGDRIRGNMTGGKAQGE